MNFLSRIFKARRKRSLEAGGGGRRWDSAPSISNLNASLDAGGPAIRRRGAYYARNNPHVSNAINAHVANIIGTGIRPRSRHPDPEMRKRLNSAFEQWIAQADIAGRTDFYGLQAQAVRNVIEAGEAFARFRVDTDSPVMPLRLQMLASDQIDSTLHRDLDGGTRIRAGVEFNADGRRTFYHVLPARPGDPNGVNWNPFRVPASEVMHVFEALEVGQVRGLSALAPVLLRVHDLDQYEDAQLVRQKVAALFAGFLIDPNGDAAGFDGTKDDSILSTGLEPGTLKVLPPGYDIRFSDPAEVGNVNDFIKAQLRAIAAGIGVTYEQMTGDLEGVNYSSIRAGLIEYRRRVDTFRWTVFIPQFCRPVWERFINMAVLTGMIPASELDRDAASLLAVEWHPPAWEYVDPLKDIKADREAVEAGFKSRSQVINELGEDPEQVDAQRAEDTGRSARLGLSEAENGGDPTAPDDETEDRPNA